MKLDSQTINNNQTDSHLNMRHHIFIMLYLLILCSSHALAEDISETGSGYLPKVTVTNKEFLNVITNVVIPKADSLKMDARSYDIYVYVYKSKSEKSPYEYGLNITVENTNHVPYSLAIPSKIYAYTYVNGFLVFFNEMAVELYTAKLRKKNSFRYDNRDIRPDLCNNAAWTFAIVGDIRHPKQFQFNSICYYKKSAVRSSIILRKCVTR